MRVYLAGPIDHAGGRCDGLRAATTAALGEAGLAVYDPSSAFRHAMNDPQACMDLNDWALESSDGVLAMLPAGIPTTGTCMEVLRAHQLKKPLVIVGGEGSMQLAGMGVTCHREDQIVLAVSELKHRMKNVRPIGETGPDILSICDGCDPREDCPPAGCPGRRPDGWVTGSAWSDGSSPTGAEPRPVQDARTAALFGLSAWAPVGMADSAKARLLQACGRSLDGKSDRGFREAIQYTGQREFQPEQQHEGDAGFDLYVSEDTVCAPGAFQDVHCGISMELPTGYWAMVIGRSSTLRKRGLLVTPGHIDNGYRGPLWAGCYNMTGDAVHLKTGERIAQLVPYKLETHNLRWERSASLGSSDRGENSFGSTGL